MKTRKYDRNLEKSYIIRTSLEEDSDSNRLLNTSGSFLLQPMWCYFFPGPAVILVVLITVSDSQVAENRKELNLQFPPWRRDLTVTQAGLLNTCEVYCCKDVC